MNEVFSIYGFLMIFAAFLTGISQILLKNSASEKKNHIILEYLNWKVIFSYAIFILVIALNLLGYKGVSFKVGSAIAATSYLWVIFLSSLILKEKLSIMSVIGNLIVFLGIVIITYK